jgi:pimeloyl-ACP methyl ester carboxylesterase
MAFFQLGGLADRLVARGDFALIERLWRDWSPGFRPEPGYLDELKRCLSESMPAPLEYYRALLRPPGALRARLRAAAKIGAPTLYLHGREDGCIGPELAEGQARYFASLKAEVLEGAGHFLHLERPEAVAARVVEWLR